MSKLPELLKWILERFEKIFLFFWKKSAASVVILRENTQFSQLTAWWHMGTNNGNPGMQIVGNFLVTNISEENVILTGAELKKSKARGEVHVKELSSKYHSKNYLIPSGRSTNMSIYFWIEPPIKGCEEDFIDDIAIFDQKEKRHWIKKVSFKYI